MKLTTPGIGQSGFAALQLTQWSPTRHIWVAYGLSFVLFGLQPAGNTGVTPLDLFNLAGLGLLVRAARVWTGSLSIGIGMHPA